MVKKRLANSQFILTQNTIKFLNVLDLSPTAKLVLIYLTICYNPKNKEVYPKQKTIAQKIGISERSVVRAINELIKLNICTKLDKHSCHNYYSFTAYFFETVYFIDLKEKRTDNINYELWRDAIYKKYNGVCQNCGKSDGIMHAHHQLEYAQYPEKRYDISNGLLLCEECHKKLHPWMK